MLSLFLASRTTVLTAFEKIELTVKDAKRDSVTEYRLASLVL